MKYYTIMSLSLKKPPPRQNTKGKIWVMDEKMPQQYNILTS